ncbi:hypothetical protein BSKO_02173 [Bryopsis sp. KO-2023]|nr:hypothetical protein BSKO_02173 [Bryopsis sp. KO-2023]
MVFSGRRKSWAMKSARATPFDSLQDSRSSSFSLSRRSVTGTGALSAPRVVESVGPDGTPETAERKGVPEKRRQMQPTQMPDPSGTTSSEISERVSERISDTMRGVDGSADARSPGASDENWPPSPSRNSQHVYRAGSLDFWQASMSLAGLYPNGDPTTSNRSWNGNASRSITSPPPGLPPLMNQRAVHPAFAEGRLTPTRSHGRSCSASSFQSRSQDPFNQVTLTPMDVDQLSSRRPSSAFLGGSQIFSRVESQESFHEWQQRARHGDQSGGTPVTLDIPMRAVMEERDQQADQPPAPHRFITGSAEANARLSMDSLCRTSGQRTPFGSFIEDTIMADDQDRSGGLRHLPPRPGGSLGPIMLYSETLEAAHQAHYAAYGTPYPEGPPGSFDAGLSQSHAHFNQPPPPPVGNSYVSDAVIYHRSLFFEQLVMRDPNAPDLSDHHTDRHHESLHHGMHHHPIPPPTEHPDDMVDIPDYPTTVHSMSNRSCHDNARHLYSEETREEDEEETETGSNTFKAWLDELEERGEYRRKECTYRIVCQRTFMKQMKDKLQASKLALNRLKMGLGPELTEKVLALRTRFSSRRRMKAIEDRRKYHEEEDLDLWAGPMLEMEVELELEVGYESDSSWVSAEDDILMA